MSAVDREATLKRLLAAGSATRVEQVLDDAGITLERSDQEPDQIQEFWQHLLEDLASASPEQTALGFNRLVRYARASIQARARR